MIELGLVLLVNAGLSSPPFQGGYFVQALPSNPTYPTWVWQTISRVPNTGLLFVKGLNMMRFEIHCLGSQDAQGADAVTLAYQIDAILNGFAGNLPDPDATFVSSCVRSDVDNRYFDSFRTYGRMLEYELQFASQT
jgi:hypothetical protein